MRVPTDDEPRRERLKDRYIAALNMGLGLAVTLLVSLWATGVVDVTVVGR